MNLFDLTGPALYFAIFFGKILEVSASTIRIMLVGRGRKIIGACFGLIEVTIWVLVASSVLTDLRSDPIKVVVYCVSFSIGIVLGVTLEGWLAVGLASLQIVSPAESGDHIGALLRENGFGVTLLEGHSVDGSPKRLVFVQLKRKLTGQAMELVRSVDPNAFITVSDVKVLKGGFLKK